jgi:hypothetical protein
MRGPTSGSKGGGHFTKRGGGGRGGRERGAAFAEQKLVHFAFHKPIFVHCSPKIP